MIELILDTLLQQWKKQSIAEIFAVVFSLSYVFLAARQHILCWLFAFMSTGLFIIVFWDATLIFQTALNIFYLVMAVVGYLQWTKNKNNNLPSSLSLSFNSMAIVVGIFASFVLSMLADEWFIYDLLILDAVITVFSVFATVLTIRKVTDSWLYWIAIDSLSVWLFYSAQLYLSALLFAFFTCFAIYGFYNWRRAQVSGSKQLEC